MGRGRLFGNMNLTCKDNQKGHVCKTAETKSRNYWFEGEDDTIQLISNCVCENFCKNSVFFIQNISYLLKKKGNRTALSH